MAPEALGRLLDRHAAALALYARQFCGSPDDVVQEAFLRLSVIAPEPNDPVAWLYRVVRNLSLDASAAAGRRRRHEARAAEASAGWFESRTDLAPESVGAAELEEALRLLPREEREVIVSHLWGGLTFEQIARAAGTSSSTAHRLYRRGLEALRARLGVSCPTKSNPR